MLLKTWYILNSIVNKLYLVNCATVSNGEVGFCYCNTCSENEGDCDAHDECQDDLFCGSNNGPASLGFHSEFDCCYVPTVGNEHFCTSDNPCAVDEGDCDSHYECQNSLACGSNNCPHSIGLAADSYIVTFEKFKDELRL